MASKRGKILIVDDNAGIRKALKILLPLYFEQVEAISSPSNLVSTLENFKPNVVLLDMNFHTEVNTGNEGLYWVGELKKIAPDVEVVLFTAYADIELAVEGMKRGAFDFIVKPWDNEKLISTLTAARDKSNKAMRSSFARPSLCSGQAQDDNQMSTTRCHPERSKGAMFWGTSKPMAAIRKTVDKIAPTDANVLITGENGTGKDLLAYQIHINSLRSQKPMVAVDAGAITETLFESELFGHVKGAFTDAHSDHAGKFEQANGGTLFLDEIGNIPLHLQAKLLRAIQNRTIVRVGGTQQIPVNIRLICATNMDLPALVRDGRFREDLYYRINTVHIELPSLRERADDILPMAEIFMKMFAEKYGRPIVGIDDDAKRLLLSNRWSGNIRELQNVMEKAVILSDSKMLSVRDLEIDSLNSALKRISDSFTIRDVSDAEEEELIKGAIQKFSGNISAAAKALGISRPTMYAKLKKYGL